MKESEAMKVMEEIEQMIFDKIGEEAYCRILGDFGSIIEYRTSQGGEGIFFLNNCIYCSENTYREWDDEKDDYKLTLKEFVISEINKFIDLAGKLKI